MKESTRLLADSCWLSEHTRGRNGETGTSSSASLAPRQPLLCPLAPAPRPPPGQSPRSSEGVGARVSDAPSSGSARELLQRGKEKESRPAARDSLQMVAGGSRTARASPAAPERRCLGPFPADFISYWVACGIASSSATSSIHRGRRTSRLFLLTAEGTSSSTEAGPCRKWQPQPGGESSLLPPRQRAGGPVEAVPPQRLAAPPLPPAQQARQLHQHFQPPAFPAERGDAWLSSMQVSSTGAWRTRSHGPR